MEFPPSPVVWIVAAALLVLGALGGLFWRLRGRRTALGVVLHLSSEQARRLGNTDLLTGLPNWRVLHSYLEQALRRAAESARSVAVLMISLDRFKQVNEAFGYHIGDELLKKMAHRIQGELRYADDLLARHAGDEFVAVLPNIQVSQLLALKDRIRGSVEDYRMTIRNGTALTVGVSVGEAVYPWDGGTAQELLWVAGQRMFQEKQAHRAAGGGGQTVIPFPVRNPVSGQG